MGWMWQTHDGGFLGSPSNFIFFPEAMAAAGERISHKSLCRGEKSQQLAPTGLQMLWTSTGHRQWVSSNLISFLVLCCLFDPHNLLFFLHGAPGCFHCFLCLWPVALQNRSSHDIFLWWLHCKLVYFAALWKAVWFDRTKRLFKIQCSTKVTTEDAHAYFNGPKQNYYFYSGCQAYLKSCQVVSDDTLLPDVLSSLGWVRQTTTIFLLLLLWLCLQDRF